MSLRMIASHFTPEERAFERNTLAHLKIFSKVIDVTRFITVNHWEIDNVKIGNHWYQVDVPFDDPAFVNENGRRLIHSAGPTIDPRKISHKFFLCSDAALCGHRSWTTKGLPRATDRTFDNRVWS